MRTDLREVVTVIRLADTAFMEPVLTTHAHEHVFFASFVAVASVAETESAGEVVVVGVLGVGVGLVWVFLALLRKGGIPTITSKMRLDSQFLDFMLQVTGQIAPRADPSWLRGSASQA